jgi:hypothetical protein
MVDLILGLMLPVGSYGSLESLRDLVLGEGASFDVLVLEERPESELDPVVALADLAQRGNFAAVGVMMGPDSGRPPSVMAKLFSGIDVTTDGRAFVVIGDLSDVESQNYDRTEDALVLIGKMFANDATTHQGPYFAAEDAWNTPRRSVKVPGFSKAMHAMGLHEVLARANTGASLPSALVVEIGNASREERTELSQVLQGESADVTRVAVITVGSAPGRPNILDKDERAIFDSLLFRFEHVPPKHQLRELSDMVRSV